MKLVASTPKTLQVKGEKMDEYDDFGNYIGGGENTTGFGLTGSNDVAWGVGDADALDENDEPVDMRGETGGEGSVMVEGGGAAGGAIYASAIVLHEDKKYFPDANEVYPEAETLVEEEDTQPLTQPLVAPVEVQTFSSVDETPPATNYTPEFLVSLLGTPSRVRTVAFVGHLHHGKTALADLLIESTLVDKWNPARSVRYTDARLDEQARGISIKTTPFTVVLSDLAGRSSLLQCLDTPGHVNFTDEVSTGVRLADGVVIVVDVLEGALLGTERAMRLALMEGLPCILALTKMDRLILDLKLPPTDAYLKIVQVLGEVNALSARYTPHGTPARVFTPTDGSVVFVGAQHGWSFTLESFSQKCYGNLVERGGAGLLASRLWGDIWYCSGAGGGDGRFQRTPPPSSSQPRSFVQFILEPLYKVYATCVGETPPAVREVCKSLGLTEKDVPKSVLSGNARPLLKCVLGAWLGGGCAGLVSSLLAHTRSPLQAGPFTVERLYTGDKVSREGEDMRKCNQAGILMLNTVKLVSDATGKSFLALGKVLSGTLTVGQKVRVLGEAYSAEESEDMQLGTVRGILIGQGRYTLSVPSAPPGALVLVEGLGEAMVKGATVTSAGEEGADVGIFSPVSHDSSGPCVNVSVEPLNPSELPRVLAGLRSLLKSYPSARSRVEESGEHVLMGSGELALDSMLRDLREVYAKVEVKVSDPVVSFNETVAEQSSLQCFALTPNKKNKLTMLAEPLDKGGCHFYASFCSCASPPSFHATLAHTPLQPAPRPHAQHTQ